MVPCGDYSTSNGGWRPNGLRLRCRERVAPGNVKNTISCEAAGWNAVRGASLMMSSANDMLGINQRRHEEHKLARSQKHDAAFLAIGKILPVFRLHDWLLLDDSPDCARSCQSEDITMLQGLPNTGQAWMITCAYFARGGCTYSARQVLETYQRLCVDLEIPDRDCTERSRCSGQGSYTLGVIVRLIQWSA
jgi:hypothetical protein